jgi:hypothetical protein
VKYIVVYIIFILGLTSLDAEAQKPTIDLLPFASESVHPEAMIDTCITRDSLVLYDSLSPLHDSIRKADTPLVYTGDTSPVIRRRANHTIRRANHTVKRANHTVSRANHTISRANHTVSRANHTVSRTGLVWYPLIFRKITIFSFIIYFTALKF